MLRFALIVCMRFCSSSDSKSLFLMYFETKLLNPASNIKLEFLISIVETIIKFYKSKSYDYNECFYIYMLHLIKKF